MNKAIALISLLLVLTSVRVCQGWDKEDTKREMIYVALHMADWGQTRYIAEHPGEFYELNPILGPHPGIGEVNRFFLLTGIVHVGISALLPDQKEYRFLWWEETPRGWWQNITISVKAGVVGRNFALGIGVEF